MAAPAFQTNTSVSSTTITKPTGVTSTDWVVAFFVVYSTNASLVVTVSGLTKRWQTSVTAVGGGAFLYFCLFDTNGTDVSASPASWTIGQAGEPAYSGYAVRISGTSGWDATADRATKTTAASAAATSLPTITTSAADDLVFCQILATSVSQTTPAGWTALTIAGGSGYGFYIAQAVAGVSSAATTTPNASSDMYFGVTAYKAVVAAKSPPFTPPRARRALMRSR